MRKPKPSTPKPPTLLELCQKLHDSLYVASGRAQSALMPAKDGEIMMQQFGLAFETLRRITEIVRPRA